MKKRDSELKLPLVKTCGCGAEEWRELLMLSAADAAAATHCTRSYGGGNITHHLRCAAPALRLPNLRDVVDGSLRVSVRASSLHDRADERVTECAVAAGRDASQTHEMKNGMNGERDGHPPRAGWISCCSYNELCANSATSQLQYPYPPPS